MSKSTKYLKLRYPLANDYMLESLHWINESLCSIYDKTKNKRLEETKIEYDSSEIDETILMSYNLPKKENRLSDDVEVFGCLFERLDSDIIRSSIRMDIKSNDISKEELNVDGSNSVIYKGSLDLSISVEGYGTEGDVYIIGKSDLRTFFIDKNAEISINRLKITEEEGRPYVWEVVSFYMFSSLSLRLVGNSLELKCSNIDFVVDDIMSDGNSLMVSLNLGNGESIIDMTTSICTL